MQRLKGMANSDFSNVLYIDETGIQEYLCREYGYSLIGEPIPSCRRGRKFGRKNLVAAIRGRGGAFVSPMVYDESMTANFFVEWFRSFCNSGSVSKGDILVMDNATFHPKARLERIARRHGMKLLFLPPYSPDLNPIEKVFGVFKRLIRKVAEQFKRIEDAIEYAIKILPSS